MFLRTGLDSGQVMRIRPLKVLMDVSSHPSKYGVHTVFVQGPHNLGFRSLIIALEKIKTIQTCKWQTLISFLPLPVSSSASLPEPRWIPSASFCPAPWNLIQQPQRKLPLHLHHLPWRGWRWRRQTSRSRCWPRCRRGSRASPWSSRPAGPESRRRATRKNRAGFRSRMQENWQHTCTVIYCAKQIINKTLWPDPTCSHLIKSKYRWLICVQILEWFSEQKCADWTI